MEDAVSYARDLPKADARKVGLHGESLGGYLSIAFGARSQEIGAISIFGAGLPLGESIRRLPPVLIQHGEDDEIVSISEVSKIADELKRLGVAYTIKIYPSVGHYPSRSVQGRIAAQVVTFFTDHFYRESNRRLLPKGTRQERCAGH